MVSAVQSGAIVAAAHYNLDLQYTINQEPCDTAIVGAKFDSTGYAVALQPGHRLTKLFSWAIIKVRRTARQSGEAPPPHFPLSIATTP